MNYLSQWIFRFAAAIFVVAGLSAGMAQATPVGLTGPIEIYSPPFGAAHRTAVVNDLNAALGVTDVVYLGRLNPNGGVEYGPVLTGTGASISGTGLTGKSGTWTFTQGSTTYEVVGIEINGGSKGALYLVTPAALNGFWDTNDLTAGASSNTPNLSHMDFFARIASTTTVPEPATLALIGAGLVGVWSVRRRKASA